MDVGASVLFERFRERIEAKGARHGLVYPWWIPVLSTVGLVGGAAAGAVQRLDVAPGFLLLLAAAVTVGPCVAHFVIRPWLPWWVELPVVLLGVGWLITTPVPESSGIDIAPIALTFAVGEIIATDGGRRGLLAAAASIGVLVAFGDYPSDALAFFVGEVVIGLVFGYMLRWQMRALAAEHLARDEERERATLDERQRVAREIHDLVAHSLSVTMLHVTGARRALEQDADVADAVEALTDAERIGRQAMADIRRTVGVLASDRTSRADDVRPLPGTGDLDDLVAVVRAAGLEVGWTCAGDLARISPAAGLGLYRVVQESLANAAKHAPGAAVVVHLVVDVDATRLTITNPVRETTPGDPGGAGGSGVSGMTARVAELGGRLEVGRRGATWRVALVLPLNEPGTREGHDCAMSRLLT